MANICIVGYGAITQGVLERLTSNLRVTHIVVKKEKIASTQTALPSGIFAVDTVPNDAKLVIECAGHSAILTHVIPALKRGVSCGVLSVGALSELTVFDEIESAVKLGREINPLCQLHLISGAIGGIDALSAAKLDGLTSVTYIGRKPPQSWKDTPAENVCDLNNLTEPVVLLQTSAREAARLFPKNANVAATVSIAGLGLDATQVCLIADPTVTQNVHEIHALGAFGSLKIEMIGNALHSNPKTSMLTVLAALRFMGNQVNLTTI